MIKKISHVSLLVRDQQEALEWYQEKLDFEKRADDPFPNSPGRWITMSPKNQTDLQIVLQPADGGGDNDSAHRAEIVGKGPGWVLVTDDCQGDYERFQSRGVEFISPPEKMPWGISAVFVDLYGTHHSLLEPYAFGYATRDVDEQRD